MEKNEQNNFNPVDKRISRKKFLRTCGSIVAGGAVLGVSAVLMKDKQNGILSDELGASRAKGVSAKGSSFKMATEKAFASPYKLTSSFSLPEQIDGLGLYEDKIFVASAKSVSIFDSYGKKLHHFDIKDIVRDIAVNDDGVFLLHPKSVAVYTRKGEILREWEACSDLSDYCSFAIAQGFVYATDVVNKNICQYTDRKSVV